jgi:hypothetical protein
VVFREAWNAHFGVRLDASAVDVRVSNEQLFVVLADGRELAAPLAWFPRLAEATDEQRQSWRLIGRGHGIHWPDLDEDISVESLSASELTRTVLGAKRRVRPHARGRALFQNERPENKPSPKLASGIKNIPPRFRQHPRTQATAWGEVPPWAIDAPSESR